MFKIMKGNFISAECLLINNGGFNLYMGNGIWVGSENIQVTRNRAEKDAESIRKGTCVFCKQAGSCLSKATVLPASDRFRAAIQVVSDV